MTSLKASIPSSSLARPSPSSFVAVNIPANKKEDASAPVSDLIANTEEILSSQYGTNELYNFFLLKSFSSGAKLRVMIQYLLCEFTAAFVMTFIPTVLTLIWTSYQTATGQNPIAFKDPSLALLLAFATSTSLFSIYSLMPGATGDPFLIFEQFVLEYICEFYTPQNHPGFIGFVQHNVSKVLFLLKAVFGFVFACAGAVTGVYYAQFTAPLGNMPGELNMTNDDFGADNARAILLEAMAFGVYIVLYNLVLRVGPHGHLPVAGSKERTLDVLQVCVHRFLSVLILSSVSGSSMNVLRAWATSLVINSNFSNSAWTYFIGQATGFVVGSVGVSYFHHFPRYFYKATVTLSVRPKIDENGKKL